MLYVIVFEGVENIYTQHKPQLHDVLDQLLKGKLREAAFPYMGNTQLRDRSDTHTQTHTLVIVPPPLFSVAGDVMFHTGHSYVHASVGDIQLTHKRDKELFANKRN